MLYGFIRSNESVRFFDSTLQVLILKCLVKKEHRPFCILQDEIMNIPNLQGPQTPIKKRRVCYS